MLKKLLLTTAFAMALASTASAATLFSDNFNANTPGLGLAPGTKAPIGWDVTSGSVDIIPCDATTCGGGYVGPFDFYPGNGLYIDMNGSTTQNGVMETEQHFDLVAGNTYTISFDYGQNKNSDYNQDGLHVNLDIGSFFADLFLQGAPVNFLQFSQSFVATALDFDVALAFKGFLTPGDNGGFIIDNISFAEGGVVPVPPAAALFVTALAGLGFLARRRSRRSLLTS